MRQAKSTWFRHGHAGERISLLSLILAALISLLIGSKVEAQHWKPLQPPFSRDLFSPEDLVPYFLNPQYGFVFSPGFIWDSGPSFVQPFLFRTIDGGISWERLGVPDRMIIAQLYFVSPSTGYAATVRENGKSGGIYTTSDCGSNWRQLKVDSSLFSSIYAVGDHLFVSTSYPVDLGSNLMISSDRGSHWLAYETLPSTDDTMFFQLVTGNRDSLVAVVTWLGSGKAYLAYSTDLGAHWDSISVPTSGRYPTPYGVFVPPHSCTIYYEYIDSIDALDDTYSFSVFDVTSKISTHVLSHYETSGFICGNSCTMFLPSAWGSTKFPDSTLEPGVFRSTDLGLTWSFQAGPTLTESDDGDFPAISVVGYGAVAYSSDQEVGLYKTTDGGDGKLSVALLRPRFKVSHQLSSGGQDTLFVNQCGSGAITAQYGLLSCSFARIQSMRVEGLDTLEYSASVAHHVSCEWMPDSARIAVMPLFQGSRDLIVHAMFIDDEYQILDTTFHLVLVSGPGPPEAPARVRVSPGEIRSGSVSQCRDTTFQIYVSSVGCGNLQVLTAVLHGNDVALSLGHIPSGIAIATTDSITIHYDPSKAQFVNDTLVISTNARMVRIPLLIKSLQPKALLALDKDILLMPPHIMRCELDSAIVNYENTSCKSIVIDSFSVLTLPFGLRGTAPDTLAPGQQASVKIYFYPADSGSYRSSLHFHYHALDGEYFDTVLNITAQTEYPLFLNVGVKSGIYSAVPGATVAVPVIMTSGGPMMDRGEFVFTLFIHFSTQNVTPVDFVTAIDGIYLKQAIAVDGNRVIVSLVTIGGPPVGYNNAVIGHLICRLYLSDSTSTELTLDSISATGVSLECSPFAIENTTCTIVVDSTCLDPILKYMRSGELPFRIESIVPNSANTAIHVRLHAWKNAPLIFQVFDVLGRPHNHGELSTSDWNIDVTNLSSGLYNLVITRDNYQATRRFLIEK